MRITDELTVRDWSISDRVNCGYLGSLMLFGSEFLYGHSCDYFPNCNWEFGELGKKLSDNMLWLEFHSSGWNQFEWLVLKQFVCRRIWSGDWNWRGRSLEAIRCAVGEELTSCCGALSKSEWSRSVLPNCWIDSLPTKGVCCCKLSISLIEILLCMK